MRGDDARAIMRLHRGGRVWRWFPPLLLFFLIVIAPWLATHDPVHANSGDELQSPSMRYWLGTDHLGRDEWSRLVIGGRRTLGSTLLASAIATGGGLILGSLTATSPRALRWVFQAIVDALLAFPALLLALVVKTLLESNILTLALSIGLAGIAPYARVAAGAIEVAGTQAHIEGARSIGATPWHIVTRHILPSALPTLASFSSVMFAWSLLYGAAFAYLGLGGDIAAPDWGLMIARAQGYLQQAPLLTILPGGMIALCVWLAYRFADAITEF